MRLKERLREIKRGREAQSLFPSLMSREIGKERGLISLRDQEKGELRAGEGPDLSVSLSRVRTAKAILLLGRDLANGGLAGERSGGGDLDLANS